MILSPIEDAFGMRLEANTAMPVVWPNRTKILPEKPYHVVAHIPGEHRSVSTDGSGGNVEFGSFIVTTVTQTNDFSAPGNNAADEVAALFPMNQTLDVGTRKFRITRRPQPLGSERDGSDWRTQYQYDYIVTGK